MLLLFLDLNQFDDNSVGYLVPFYRKKLLYSVFATLNSTWTAETPTGLDVFPNTHIRSHLLEKYQLHLK